MRVILLNVQAAINSAGDSLIKVLGNTKKNRKIELNILNFETYCVINSIEGTYIYLGTQVPRRDL